MTTQHRKVDTLTIMLKDQERDLLTNAILASEGNVAQAARMLGINERKMWRRVKALEIDYEDLRKEVAKCDPK